MAHEKSLRDEKIDTKMTSEELAHKEMYMAMSRKIKLHRRWW